MSSFNENSSAENRGAIQEYPVNNTNINTYTIDLIREVTNLYNINMHYCTHCRSYVNHLAYNCNHTTLRIFDHELCNKIVKECIDINEWVSETNSLHYQYKYQS